MITIRKAQERGYANYGWLDTHHTFSFANYYDPNYLGFRSLRVINEDKVSPGAGFGTHGHRNMEIITYVLEGELEHQDSLGNGSVIHAGDIQRMSAGTGIMHSEFNHSSSNPVHFLQIWIIPQENGLSPSYEQYPLTLAETPGQLQLIAASKEAQGIVTIHQDVKLYAGKLGKGDRISYSLSPQRHAWVQVARGELSINNYLLNPSDGVAISEEAALSLEAKTDTEILLFDLA